MIVSVTGHRPEDLLHPEWVYSMLKQVIIENNVKLLIQGMAAGVDLMSAEVCIETQTPYVAAKPWASHTPRNSDKQLYDKVLKNATEIVDVNKTDTYTGAWLYHARNEYMVNRADTVIAVWSGKTTGGTAACVRYAKKQGKNIIQINPVTQTITYIGLPKIIEPQNDTLF